MFSSQPHGHSHVSQYPRPLCAIYSTNVKMLLQATGGKLRPTVTLGNYVGQAASPVEQIGQVAATRITNRDGDTVYTSPDEQRRWVFPIDYDPAQLISRQDQLRLLIEVPAVVEASVIFAMVAGQSAGAPTRSSCVVIQAWNNFQSNRDPRMRMRANITPRSPSPRSCA
jgi:Phage capsid protein